MKTSGNVHVDGKWVLTVSPLIALVTLTEPIVRFLRSDQEFFLVHKLTSSRLLIWIIALQFVSTILMMVPVGAATLLIRKIRRVPKILASEFSQRLVVVLPAIFIFSIRGGLLSTGTRLVIALVLTFGVTRYRKVFTPGLISWSTFAGLIATGAVLKSSVDEFDRNARRANSLISTAEDEGGGPSVDVPREPKDTYLIVLDEFQGGALLDQDGKLLEEMFPSFAQLVNDGAIYTDAVAPSRWTSVAVPAVMTGGSESWLESTRSPVFEALSKTHRIIAREFVTNYCARGSCQQSSEDDASIKTIAADSAAIIGGKFLPGLLSAHFPDLGFRRSRFWSTKLDRQQEFQQWTTDVTKALSSLKAEEKPIFGFVHTIVSHHPWMLDPEGRWLTSSRVPYSDTQYLFGLCANHENGVSHEVQGFRWSCSEDSAELLRRMYALNLQGVDRLIGTLIENLKMANRYHNSLIAIVGDHGITFTKGEDGRRGAPDVPLSEAIINETLNPGLIVKYPSNTQIGQVEAKRSTMQLATTILEANGVGKTVSLLPGLNETLDTISFEGIPYTWERDKGWSAKRSGSLALLKNNDFPYAVGPRAVLVGDSVKKATSRKRKTVGFTVYEGSSDHFQLVHVHMKSAGCTGAFLISHDGLYVGTLSVVSEDGLQFDGVVQRNLGQAKYEANDLQVHCVK